MISTILLSHNDETTLDRTLKSVQWSDEIVVIDDYSVDKTVEIVRKFGAIVYQRKLQNNFSGQRNFGLSKAAGEWVLFVDSDEVITDALRTEIQNATQSTRAQAFRLKRQDYFLGTWLSHGETSRVRLVRLAKKNNGTWVEPVHEVWNVQGPVLDLQEPILHYPHPNVAQFLSEINRYSTLRSNFLHQQSYESHWWHIFMYPTAKFFVNYIWYLGILDGTPGTIHAIMMSFHSFLTRAKLYVLSQKK